MTSYRKRILVLTSTFPRWRDDTEPPFVLELCRRLNESFRIHVLAPHSHGALSEDQFNNIRVTRFRYFLPGWEELTYHGGILANLRQQPLRLGLVPFYILFQVVAIFKLLRRYRFDLIHAHWLIPQGLCATIARRLTNNAPPLLCTSHGADVFGLSGKFMAGLKRWVLRDASAITTVSQAMRDAVRPIATDMEKVQVIPMGVDLLSRFVPPKNRKLSKSILFVGRVVEKKGLRFLVEAMPKILEKHPDAELRVAGDGQELIVIKKQAEDLGVSGRIQFLGALANDTLPKLYQTADVVVFPSVVASDGDREGFGLVLVEALGCECTAIVTDLPAMRDIVHDGKTAIVVPQRNTQQIAEKVIWLLDNPSIQQPFRKNGRQYVLQRFDWQIVAKRYTSLINMLIND